MGRGQVGRLPVDSGKVGGSVVVGAGFGLMPILGDASFG